LSLRERSSISFREAQSYYKTSTPWKGWVIRGKELARRINRGILVIHNGEPSPPVFEMVFNTLDALVKWIFGSYIVSLRFISFTIIGSTLCSWAYLTGIHDVSLVRGIFESYRSILTFFILSSFSLITNILAIAQTQLFLRFFRANPTGLSFLVLAYSDLVLKGTLYVLIFSLGIVFSIMAMDVNMQKAIPAAVSWRQSAEHPPPLTRREPDESLSEEFCVGWLEVMNPRYSDYQRPIVEITNESLHTHCQTVRDAHSEDEFRVCA
jgi:hypothetical protein